MGCISYRLPDGQTRLSFSHSSPGILASKRHKTEWQIEIQDQFHYPESQSYFSMDKVLIPGLRTNFSQEVCKAENACKNIRYKNISEIHSCKTASEDVQEASCSVLIQSFSLWSHIISITLSSPSNPVAKEVGNLVAVGQRCLGEEVLITCSHYYISCTVDCRS